MSSAFPTLTIRKGHLKPIHAGHPWIFASAIHSISGRKPESGDEVRVADPQGQVLGHGYYSSSSAISVRLLTRGDQSADESLLADRIKSAIQLRKEILRLGDKTRGQPLTDAFRLINSEGDGLPGLIVDQYGSYLCIQFGTAGMALRGDYLLAVLQELLSPKGILDKSDARIRKLENLDPPKSPLLGGEEPEGPIEVHELGLAYNVDLRKGQKTGLYLDQRENRGAFGSFAFGMDVLDVFSYGGGFSLNASREGARSLTLIDSSGGALDMARTNMDIAGIQEPRMIQAVWPEAFRQLREEKKNFDLMVIDPPKFAQSQQQVSRALSSYRDLNAQAVRLLRPGGLLFTCSCSGNVSEFEFERTIASGLASAGRRGILLERRGAGRDHPVPPGFESGSYLKCLVLRVD